MIMQACANQCIRLGTAAQAVYSIPLMIKYIMFFLLLQAAAEVSRAQLWVSSAPAVGSNI
jgi:hypothetical protein